MTYADYEKQIRNGAEFVIGEFPEYIIKLDGGCFIDGDGDIIPTGIVLQSDTVKLLDNNMTEGCSEFLYFENY